MCLRILFVFGIFLTENGFSLFQVLNMKTGYAAREKIY